MGDGKIKKHCLILNSSAGFQYARQVKRSIARLDKGGCRLYVMNPKEPVKSVHQHYYPTGRGMQEMIEDVRKKIDNDDELVIYLTGRGREAGKICFKQRCVGKEIYKALDDLKFGRRTVIVDLNAGYSLKKYFADDAKTLFVSSSKRDDIEPGGSTSAISWQDATHLKSWRERFAAAYKGYRNRARYFIKTQGYRDYDIKSGKDARRNYSAKPITVKSQAELHIKLRSLKLGEYAVVANGHTSNIKFKSLFASAARKANGAHLFLWTQSHGLLRKHGITSAPNVLIYDSFGITYRVHDIAKIFKELANIKLSDVKVSQSCVLAYGRDITSRTEEETLNALRHLEGNVQLIDKDDVSGLAPHLKKFFVHKNDGIRSAAVRIYKKLSGKLSSQEVAGGGALLKSLISKAGSVVLRYANRANAQEASLAATMLARLSSYAVYIDHKKMREWAPALRKLAGSGEVDIQKNAMMAYGAFANGVSAREVLLGARQMRSLIKRGDYTICEYAVRTYLRLLSTLKPRRVAVEVRRLRRIFGSRKKYAVAAAVHAYVKLAPMLKSSEIAYGARKIRGLLGRRQSRIFYQMINAYGRLAPRLSSYEASRGVRALRFHFNIYSMVARDQMMIVYRKIAQRLGYRYADREARLLRKLFSSSNASVIDSAVSAYEHISKKMSQRQTDVEARALRTLLRRGKESVRDTALLAYNSLAERLGASEAGRGAVLMRSYFNSKDTMRRQFAPDTYRELSSRLKGASAYREAKLMRSLFGKPSLFEMATESYGKIARNLKSSWAMDEAKALRAMFVTSRTQRKYTIEDMFGAGRNIKFESSMVSYGMIAHRLSEKEKKIGARDLRVIIGDGDNDVYARKSAIEAYERFGFRLGGSEPTEGAKELRKLFTVKIKNHQQRRSSARALRSLHTSEEPDLRKIAIDTYAKHSGTMDLKEVNQGLKVLRSILKNATAKELHQSASQALKAIQKNWTARYKVAQVGE